MIAVDGVVKENSELLNQIRELRQDLIQDKASLKQILTTRSDIEQKLEVSSWFHVDVLGIVHIRYTDNCAYSYDTLTTVPTHTIH